MNRVAFLVGIAFGFLVAAARLHEYEVIHDMLLLREPDVFLLMGAAVGTAAPILWFLRRRHWRTPTGEEMTLMQQPVTRQAVAGAAVFGAGWAIAGTCPIPALAMTVSGGWLGAVVAAGLFGGIAARDAFAARQHRADPVC